jgi:hypothetical protein
LGTAITLFHKRVQESVKNNGADERAITSVLSALVHLNPFQVLGTGFLWVVDILNSGRPDGERYRIASQVMQLLEHHFRSECWKQLDVHPTWISPLAGFLSLYEVLHTAHSLKSPRFIALRILSTRSALPVFHGFTSGLLNMGNIQGIDLSRFFQEVGDPFQPTTDPLLHAGQPMTQTHYEPMTIVVALIEFASSDRWRNYLHRPNFISCEGKASTEAGEMDLRRTLDATANGWPQFLCTPQKVTATTRRLEELQCPVTARVVNAWANARGPPPAV